MVLSAIYELRFPRVSRTDSDRAVVSTEGAGTALVGWDLQPQVNWIVDADIRSLFRPWGRPEWMIRFVDTDRDPRIMPLIQKWMKAGRARRREFQGPAKGNGPRIVDSRWLANIYLDYACDLWGPIAGDSGSATGVYDPPPLCR